MKRSKMDCVTLGRKAEKAKGGRAGRGNEQDFKGRCGPHRK